MVCHLRDYERIVMERVCAALTKDEPVLEVVSNSDMAALGDYAHQHVRPVFFEYVHRRRELISTLEDLRQDQWLRRCIHPGQGPGTVLDIAINTGLHDVDHIEQIGRCLRELRNLSARRKRSKQA